MRPAAIACMTGVLLAAVGCSGPRPAPGTSPSASPGLTAPACAPSGAPVDARPAAFMLDAPRFTAAAGHKLDGTAMARDQVETWVGNSLTAMLFVGSGDGYTVYGRGFTAARLAQANSGAAGTTVRLDASTDSATTSSTTALEATLTGGVVGGVLRYQSVTAAVVNGRPNSYGFIYEAAFCATLTPIEAAEVVPPPPSGTCTVDRSGAITLTWEAAGGGATYQISRSVNAEPATVLATTARRSHTDASPEAALAGDPAMFAGVGYDIYAIGPTGLRNPIPLAFVASAPPPTFGTAGTGRAECTRIDGV